MDAVAHGMNAQLRSLVSHGGRLSHVTGASASVTTDARSSSATLTDSDRAMLKAVSGLAFNADGSPDLDGVRARGASVTGYIPGGYESVSFNDGENEVTFFIAQVSSDRRTGALTGNITPQYLRGMTMTLSENSTDVRRREFIDQALKYYDNLPSTASEAQRRINEPTFTVTV